MVVRESILKPLLVYFLVFIEEPVCWRLPNVMMMSVLLRFDLKVQDVLVSYPQMEMGRTLEHWTFEFDQKRTRSRAPKIAGSNGLARFITVTINIQRLNTHLLSSLIRQEIIIVIAARSQVTQRPTHHLIFIFEFIRLDFAFGSVRFCV